jgi:hypothetical protein
MGNNRPKNTLHQQHCAILILKN